MEIKELLKEFPFLTKKQVQAAIQFAAKRVGKEKPAEIIKTEFAHPQATPTVY